MTSSAKPYAYHLEACGGTAQGGCSSYAGGRAAAIEIKRSWAPGLDCPSRSGIFRESLEARSGFTPPGAATADLAAALPRIITK